MKKITYIILFLTCLVSICHSKDHSALDSLINQFKSVNSSSEKAVLLNQIDQTIDALVPKDSVLYVWDTLIDYCSKTNYLFGDYFCRYNKAKELRNNGHYFESLTLLNEALLFFQDADSAAYEAQVHNSLGIFYINIKKNELAQKHYESSIDIYTKLNDSIQIGWVYLNLGDMAEQQSKFMSAIFYLRNSEKILEKYDLKNLVNCYINFGELYNRIEKLDSAYIYLYNAYNLAQQIKTIDERFHSAFHLGQFLFDKNRIAEAKPFLMEAEELNKNFIIGGFAIETQALFYDVLSKYFAENEDYKTAFMYASISKNLDAQNKREQFLNELNRLNFEKQVKEEENKRRNRDVINLITLIILVFVLLFLFLLYRNYRNKQRANKLLTEMDALKTRLYSNITHELRTPLTLILGPLEQMLSSETEKAPTRKQVKMMRKNANSLLGLVNQMLDLSKIDAKNMKLELVENDINKFLRTRFTAFATLAEQKSIDYQFSLLKEKNIRVFDEVKLEKIINNLISNAIKFTKKQGEIRCFANFPKPDVLEFIVQDSGKGIPKNEQDKIFDRFHQIKSDDAINTTGTGIGLSLTKELVELMHGKIKVESEEERGTRFTVTIPLGTEHLNKDEYQLIQNLSKKKQSIKLTDVEDTDEECEIENGIVETVDTTTLQVLIVDDHRDIREFIAENLKDCFTVETAANGESAYNKATKKIPDLVITDLVMPKMDGIELCRTLKTDEKTSHIPIIMLTGKSSIEDRIEGIETGADAYLTKPFNIKELRLRAQKLIEQRQKLRERFTRDLKLEPKDIAVTSADEKFLNRVMEIIEKNIGNSEFEVRQFQEEMYMSRMQLFRKIKALTNQTPGEFIRTIRLKRAASLMKQNFGNIAQITFEVGFNNPSYFAKCFKELYGKLPSEYMKEVT